MHFQPGHKEYIALHGIPNLDAFTLCFWVKTADKSPQGTPVRYRVKYERENKHFVAIGVTLQSNDVLVNIGKTYG